MISLLQSAHFAHNQRYQVHAASAAVVLLLLFVVLAARVGNYAVEDERLVDLHRGKVRLALSAGLAQMNSDFLHHVSSGANNAGVSFEEPVHELAVLLLSLFEGYEGRAEHSCAGAGGALDLQVLGL